jgi:hypothetical protein
VTAHLVIGLAFAIAGATFLLGRRSLARREAARGRAVMGPAGWTVLAALLLLTGLLQVAAAFA